MTKDRQKKVDLARNLIQTGMTCRRVAQAVGRSPSWVYRVSKDLCIKTKRSKRRQKVISRLEPAPKNYKAKPSCEMPTIRDGRDVKDALAWWKGGLNA